MEQDMPTTINRTLRRRPNADYRPREYLTPAEVDRLIDAARKRGRNGASMGCAQVNWWACAGLRSTFAKGGCMSIELRADVPACIRCMGQSYGPCGHCRGRAPTYSSPRLERRSPQLGSCAWWRGPALLRDCRSKFIRTCSDIQPATSSPTMGMIPGAWRHYLGHRNLQSTARYTALAPDRFARFWQD